MRLLPSCIGIGLLLRVVVCGTAEAGLIDACGRIERAGECLLFRAYGESVSQKYMLPDIPELTVGSE